MKRRNNYIKLVYGVVVCALILTGCSDHDSMEEEIFMEEEKAEAIAESAGDFPEADTEDSAESVVMEPELVSADWSEYFNGLNGVAVVYDVSDRRYTMYNGDLAMTRRSPCSTFKIISSLTALEHGLITPEDSTRTWSGEMFWNEDWNRDIDFGEAFRTSCVWYYRQVIDEIGFLTWEKLEKVMEPDIIEDIKRKEGILYE